MYGGLTELKCKALLKTPSKTCDGNNLWFVVGPNQRAKWVLRFNANGKRREMGLGAYPQVGLKDARLQAQARMSEVRQDKDPIAERAAKTIASSIPTFGECAAKYIENQRDGWKNAKHAQQWTNTIQQYCTPILNKRVDMVTQDDVLNVLVPVWTRINETGQRLRSRIEKVLGLAIASKYRTDGNPAVFKGSLEFLLPKVKLEESNHPSLPWTEIQNFWSELTTQRGIGKDALTFLILTAARSGEVRGMTWAEVDFQQAIWTIPGKRMKRGRTHTVPLSPMAIQILIAQKSGGPDDYVFSIRKGTQISDMTLGAVIRRMNHKRSQVGKERFRDPDGRDAVPHGFRSTFRMWAAEVTEYPRDVAEFALAHQLPDEVEAAYQRSTLFAKRIEMMRDWTNFVTTRST